MDAKVKYHYKEIPIHPPGEFKSVLTLSFVGDKYTARRLDKAIREALKHGT